QKPRQPPRTIGPGGGANSSRSPGIVRDLEDVGKASDRTSAPQGGGFFLGKEKEDRMSVESLKCKECGATYELGASYACENCFGPLEVAYDHSRFDAAEAKRQIQAGSQGIWRYADFLPFTGRPGDPL